MPSGPSAAFMSSQRMQTEQVAPAHSYSHPLPFELMEGLHIMIDAEDFDIDSALRLLDAASKNYPPGSREEETVQLAAISLLYIRRIKKLDDFFKYYHEFLDPTFSVHVKQAFATQEEADRWLASGAASAGDLVRIAGQGFQVIQLPAGMKFLRTPLPEELGPPG